MNLSEVMLSSAWVRSHVLVTTAEKFRFFGSPPAFVRMLKRTLAPKFAMPFHDKRNTRVDASNHSIPFATNTFFLCETCRRVPLS